MCFSVSIFLVLINPKEMLQALRNVFVKLFLVSVDGFPKLRNIR